MKLILNIQKNYTKTVHNGYPLAPDKTEIKGEMLFDYKLKIDLYNIPFGLLLIIKKQLS